MQMRTEIAARNKYVRFKLKAGQYGIENVNQFEYLGIRVTNDGQEGNEIQKGLKCFFTTMLKAKYVSREKWVMNK